MKKKILIVLSYVLVAALACGATLAFVYSGTESSKLLDLEDLILTRFAGDPDQTAIEDAAADAMVQAMGDRWSYYIPASEYDDFADNSANAYVASRSRPRKTAQDWRSLRCRQAARQVRRAWKWGTSSFR